MAFPVQFQSTHPRGVRQVGVRYLRPQYLCFNPRTHVGCDKGVTQCILPKTLFQSTHPRGVRQMRLKRSKQIFRFQSTHPRGVRQKTCNERYCMECFNPRTHVGCDYKKYNYSRRQNCFNPRTHVGCDVLNHRHFTINTQVSIHAPTWGATYQIFIIACLFVCVSIHAPTWGAT